MFTLNITRAAVPFISDTGGRIIIHTLRDIVKGQPIDRALARGEDKLLAVDLDINDGFEFKRIDNFLVNLGTSAVLDIVWPDEEEEQQDVVRDYNLDIKANQIYLVLVADAIVGARGDLKFRQGPLSATLGVKSGAHVGLTYLKPFSNSRPADEVFAEFFKGLRLPYHITTPSRIPSPGEVVAFQFGGYLRLGASAGFGYEISKAASAEFGKLKFESKIEVEAAARLDASYDIAGEWGVEVRAGEEDGWARVVVRKHRESNLNIAADLSVNAKINTKGVPKTPQEFLEATLDLSTLTVLGDLSETLKDPDAVLNRIHGKVQGLTEKYLSVFSDRVMGVALDSSTAGAVFDRVNAALAEYHKLERKSARLIALVETYADREEELDAFIARLKSIRDKSKLQEITDTEFWDIVRQLLGDRFAAVFTDDDVFIELKDLVSGWKKTARRKVVELIKVRRESLGLDTVLKGVRRLVSDIERVGTPARLKAHADEYLLELSNRLMGDALEELNAAVLKEKLQELAELVEQVEDFGRKLYGRFEKALNDSYTLELSRSYSRSTERDALIDVEINLRRQAGKDLMKDALVGNFSNVVRAFDPTVVKVRPSVFTHRIQKTNRLHVNLLGWERSSFREMVFSSEENLIQSGDGLIQIHTLTAGEQRERTRRDEETRMSFLFQLMAEGEQDVIAVVSRMSASYDVQIADKDTTEAELREYLVLAGRLRLLSQGPDEVLDRFRTELGVDDGKWGAVELDYQVRYDPDALMQVFRFLPRGQMEFTARTTFRSIIASHYMMFRSRSPWHANLAKVIQEDAVFQLWRRNKSRFLKTEKRRSIAYRVTGKRDPVELTQTARIKLLSLYRTEDAYVKALLRMDEVLDRARMDGVKPGKTELAAAFRKFIDEGRDLAKTTRILVGAERKSVDPFFAILDQFVVVASDDRTKTSTLRIEFERGGKSVTKIVAS